MRVRQFDTGEKRDVQQFVRFPFTLYEQCVQWVPPLLSDAEAILNRRKHPFYRHSTADFFIAESEGQTLGRVAVLENRHYNTFRNARAAFFGYLELVDDVEVARALFEAAFAWAQARHLDTIIGPRGVIGIDGSVLVAGFEHRPALGVPYNFPYYDVLIKDSGFETDAEYLSGYISAGTQLPERVSRIADRVKTRGGFSIKTFRSKKELRQWIPRAFEVHRQAMGQLHSFYPPTAEEINMVLETLLAIANPQLVKLVMKANEVAGFMIAYPDISAALQKARGQFWPFNWLHFWRELRQTKWLNVNGLGLLPAHQGRGANALLYKQLYETIQASQFEHVDIVQVDVNNFKSRSDAETFGINWYKRHRHYRLSL